MENYKRLLRYVKPYWPRLLIAMIFMGIYSATAGGLAYLMKPAIDDVFIKKNVLMLKIIPFSIIGVVIIKGIADYLQAYYMTYVGLSVIRNIRDELYSHLQSLSISFFSKTPTGTLISRITNDVNLVQHAVSDTITSIIKDFFTLIALTGVVFYRDWKLAAMALLVFPWAIIPMQKFGKRVRKFASQGQIRMANISTHLHETITGHRIIKAFGMEDYEIRRFAEENKKYFRYMLKRMLTRALSSPIVESFGVVVISLFIFYGGFRVIRGEITAGDFFMIMAALGMCYQPVKGLNKSNQTVQEGMAGAARIFAILDTKPDIVDHPEARDIPSIKSGIEFKNVWFKYEEDWVLKNINLKVTVGDIIALVGPSGAGKTTLVNLLPRFYDVQEGQILIDGQDIRKATIASLRDHIALVTQQTILFNDTVGYNIGYGKAEKDEPKIIAAAKAANAHHFIRNFPQGYNTIIGEQGVKLSGGEKQRITIARAILKNAPILILDEATSSLDSESELEVQKALENLMQNRTTFVIAHRLSTIKKANKIIVFTNGEIVGEGTHEELLKANAVYKKLYETQFLGYMSNPPEAIEPIPSEDKTQPSTGVL
ncbi:MAG: lipid A export permease/ATP-binding protein MsbA [Thermodesulfobacteriota bacterium]|nr:MAG: lipid A export permease/ATP-binding protein MsbA [Thermodesulfobacteriota bacterium]